MIAANKEIYLEEIWKDIDCRLEGTDDKLFLYCGKPLASSYYDERFENIIFRLMALFPMDGLITLTGTLTQYCGPEYFTDYISRFSDVPKVSLSLELEGSDSVVLDNYGASIKAAEHAVVDHGYTKVGYIAGPVTNDEASNRRDAVIDVLAEHGITIPSEWFYQGDFSKYHGYRGADRILSSGDNRPEIILCANDETAIGVMEFAEEKGIAIPEELAVIGFDDIGLAELQDVPLTTVRQPFSEKMSMAYDLIIGDDEPKTYAISGELVKRVSCGCGKKVGTADEEYGQKRQYMKKYHETQDGFSLMTHLSTSFSSITRLDELQLRLHKFFGVHAMSEFYVTLYTDFKRPVGKPEEFIYPDVMNFFFGYNQGKIYQPEDFSLEQILPVHVMESSPAHTYLVYPLVFKNISYGYLVCDSATANSMAFVVLKDMMINTLHRIDMHQQVEAYSRHMETLSLKDPLTELFNRRGFSKLTESSYVHLIRDGRRPAVIYCDLVGLKRINDRFGHEAGDTIICRAAEILRGFFEEDAVIARVGGDEYLIFIEDMKDYQVDTIEEKLISYVETSNRGFNKPYELIISTGLCRFDPMKPKGLDDLVREADDRLYEKRK